MDCRQALLLARQMMRAAVKADPGRFDAKYVEAEEVIAMILEQRGCEIFDPSVKDGKLTHLMDVIIFG